MPSNVTIFPTAEREVYIAKEAIGTPGTLPAAIGVPFPMDTCKPSDKPMWLEDGAWRGDMGDLYAGIEGPLIGGLDIGGHVYGDTIGHLLYNILGDYATIGTAASPASVTSAPIVAGATTITVASGGASFTAGMSLWLEDAGSPAANEVVTVLSSTATTITLAVATPCRFAHLTATPFTNTTAPYTHVFAKLNTSTSVGNGAGQPVTHTFTDRTGVPATGLAAQYSYGCVGELAFTGNAEKLLDWTGKVVNQVRTIPVSPVGVTPASGVQAYPSWRSVVGVGGVASGGTQRKEIAEWGVTIGRTVKPMFTNQGAQGPFVIARGKQSASGKMTVEPAIDESYPVAMLANTQPQLQFIASNGLSGVNLVSVQFDIGLGWYQSSDIQDGDELFGYEVPWKGVHTAAAITGATGNSLTGVSGGYGAVKVTLVNAIPTY